jgi:hypothetical protein
MKRLRRLLVVLPGAVAVLAAAGAAACGATATHGVTTGTHGPGAYVTQMKVPGQLLSASLASISKVAARSLRYPIRPTAAKEAASALTMTEVKLRDAVKRLRAIAPPAAVAREHAELTKGADELRTELKPIIAKLHQGYFVVVAELPSLQGSERIAAALARLKSKGYQV